MPLMNRFRSLNYHLKSNRQNMNYGTHLVLGCLRKQRLSCTSKLSTLSKHSIQKYKEFNILHKKLYRRLKATYFENILEENKLNIKKTWSLHKQIIRKHNDKSGFPNNFVINNTQVDDRQ